jgi:hypothetical protein
MALHKRGRFYYGDSQTDIQTELLRYSKSNGYPAEHFANATCQCGNISFHLKIDDSEGAAVRQCKKCSVEQAIGDSADYLEDAELEECECPCGFDVFEITMGVALYAQSEDVKWLYLGCRCIHCGLTACYGDWKNEYPDYQELLSRI